MLFLESGGINTSESGQYQLELKPPKGIKEECDQQVTEITIPTLCSSVQFWVPQFKKGVENLNRAHQRASKIFWAPCHITYKERLKEIHSSSLTKRKLRDYLFVDQPANMSPRDAVKSPSLVGFKTCLDKSMVDLLCCWKWAFFRLKGWRLNHFPGQSVPMLDNPLGEEKFPNIQSKPPLAQLEAISSCPITCYLGEETDPHLSTTSFQAKQSQLPQPLLIRLLLQTLPQLRCPSLDTLQHLSVSLVVGGPKLNTGFEDAVSMNSDHRLPNANVSLDEDPQRYLGLLRSRLLPFLKYVIREVLPMSLIGSALAIGSPSDCLKDVSKEEIQDCSREKPKMTDATTSKAIQDARMVMSGIIQVMHRDELAKALAHEVRNLASVPSSAWRDPNHISHLPREGPNQRGQYFPESHERVDILGASGPAGTMQWVMYLGQKVDLTQQLKSKGNELAMRAELLAVGLKAGGGGDSSASALRSCNNLRIKALTQEVGQWALGPPQPQGFRVSISHETILNPKLSGEGEMRGMGRRGRESIYFLIQAMLMSREKEMKEPWYPKGRGNLFISPAQPHSLTKEYRNAFSTQRHLQSCGWGTPMAIGKRHPFKKVHKAKTKQSKTRTSSSKIPQPTWMTSASSKNCYECIKQPSETTRRGLGGETEAHSKDKRQDKTATKKSATGMGENPILFPFLCPPPNSLIPIVTNHTNKSFARLASSSPARLCSKPSMTCPTFAKANKEMNCEKGRTGLKGEPRHSEQG
ncbi:hypothetical protein QYF61_025819 [Mycteria americana]|uniref:Uncharacterized protein n=1 Tax=Mycteria americana TaxID=33587 RepID=A0AAN7SJP0_MYCAM|nr:hypothetical protein QYF61_025819 [Mycteria americana]